MKSALSFCCCRIFRWPQSVNGVNMASSLLEENAKVTAALPRRSFLAQFAVVALSAPVAANAMSPFLSDYVKNDLENELISAQQVRLSEKNSNIFLTHNFVHL